MAKEKAGDAVTSLGLAASDGKDAVVSGTEVRTMYIVQALFLFFIYLIAL
jgi:hypothetical protein